VRKLRGADGMYEKISLFVNHWTVKEWQQSEYMAQRTNPRANTLYLSFDFKETSRTQQRRKVSAVGNTALVPEIARWSCCGMLVLCPVGPVGLVGGCSSCAQLGPLVLFCTARLVPLLGPLVLFCAARLVPFFARWPTLSFMCRRT
jgi:hypothetical protein